MPKQIDIKQIPKAKSWYYSSDRKMSKTSIRDTKVGLKAKYAK